MPIMDGLEASDRILDYFIMQEQSQQNLNTPKDHYSNEPNSPLRRKLNTKHLRRSQNNESHQNGLMEKIMLNN